MDEKLPPYGGGFFFVVVCVEESLMIELANQRLVNQPKAGLTSAY
jgi:hypothetical protein